MPDLLEMNVIGRAVFMSVLFLVTTVDICCITNLFVRNLKLYTKLLTVLFAVTGFSLFVVLTSGLHAHFHHNTVPVFSAAVAEKIGLVLVFLVLNIAYLVVLAIGEFRYRKNAVSTLTIKESIDHLPTGICFFKPDGTVQLVNHKMNELSYLIVGEELQNANLFWKKLREGKVMPRILRLSGEGNNPVFRLKDGTVYSFTLDKVENIYQITATDITGIHKLTNRLIDSNEELQEMNSRLRFYGENVDETTRARERLETKIRIHSELGQALLATRHSLNSTDADLQPVLNAWRRNIAVLRTEAEPSQSTNLLQSLVEIAQSAGVSVEIEGDMPEDEFAASLMTLAATEALTNAVRHAEATTLFVDFYESRYFHIACYANDGKMPDGEIREGGGLGSLRSKIERIGGMMEYEYDPLFTIEISVPKEVDIYV